MRRRPSRISLRSVLRFGMGGDGFLDRIRALSFAMLGLTAAGAMALVLFIANQGWPQVGSLLPVPTVHRTALSENSIVATPALRGAPTGALAAAVPAPASTGGSAAGPRRARSGSHRSTAGSDESPSSNAVVTAAPAPESTPSSPSGGSTPAPGTPKSSVPKLQAPSGSTVVTSAPSPPQATPTTPTAPGTPAPATPSAPTGPASTPASESPSPDEAEAPEAEGGDSSGHGGSHGLPSESGSPSLPSDDWSGWERDRGDIRR